MIISKNLTFSYPGAQPLHFADLDAPQGAVVLLSGPSGCGKSTWLGLVAGLVVPDSGELTVAGQNPGQLNGIASDAWRAHTIGFLPQKLHLSAALSVEQNLAMAQWAAQQPQDLPRIMETLAKLGVEGLAKRLPAQLSGGQAQRVALARAVLLDPKVILADEPTASLDDESAQSAVHLLLQTAQAQGATLVIATHDARVAPLISAASSAQPGYLAMKLARPPAPTHP